MGFKSLHGASVFATVAALAGCIAVHTSQPSNDPDWYQILYGDLAFIGDSSHPLTDVELVDFKTMTGKAPELWGRYLCNYDSSRDMIPAEVQVFKRNNLEPFIIIATTKADVENHGKSGADEARCVREKLDVLRHVPGGDIFPAAPMVFLDIEEKWRTLSPDYLNSLYRGLLDENVLQSNSKQFGIYFSALASPQVKETIRAAKAAGMEITTGWYDRYLPYKFCGPPQWWQENNIARLGRVDLEQEWLQYAGDCVPYMDPNDEGFDLSIRKPRTFGPRSDK